MKCKGDFEIVDGVLKKYNGFDENVVIPSSVNILEKWLLWVLPA